jgi:phosphoribosylformimino-5-aminoimidazole carboxamide ribotide isomerase
MEFKEAPLAEVWRLREEVMYPGKDPELARLENDREGMHIGLYKEEELVAVVSIFISANELQFRKLATKELFQGNGYASRLLREVESIAIKHKCHTIWCNARQSATGLYKKLGMSEASEPWIKNDIPYIVMKKEIE